MSVLCNLKANIIIANFYHIPHHHHISHHHHLPTITAYSTPAITRYSTITTITTLTTQAYPTLTIYMSSQHIPLVPLPTYTLSTYPTLARHILHHHNMSPLQEVPLFVFSEFVASALWHCLVHRCCLRLHSWSVFQQNLWAWLLLRLCHWILSTL